MGNLLQQIDISEVREYDSIWLGSIDSDPKRPGVWVPVAAGKTSRHFHGGVEPKIGGFYPQNGG